MAFLEVNKKDPNDPFILCRLGQEHLKENDLEKEKIEKLKDFKKGIEEAKIRR